MEAALQGARWQRRHSLCGHLPMPPASIHQPSHQLEHEGSWESRQAFANSEAGSVSPHRRGAQGPRPAPLSLATLALVHSLPRTPEGLFSISSCHNLMLFEQSSCILNCLLATGKGGARDLRRQGPSCKCMTADTPPPRRKVKSSLGTAGQQTPGTVTLSSHLALLEWRATVLGFWPTAAPSGACHRLFSGPWLATRLSKSGAGGGHVAVLWVLGASLHFGCQRESKGKMKSPSLNLLPRRRVWSWRRQSC